MPSSTSAAIPAPAPGRAAGFGPGVASGRRPAAAVITRASPAASAAKVLSRARRCRSCRAVESVQSSWWSTHRDETRSAAVTAPTPASTAAADGERGTTAAATA
ncbi:hypothetical protein A8W25_20015 [Streptomyces sp. ERV7]|uniref:hypothetical protein n=1 Tax=Streptomyces sp. ERV7 TaxID=1322334 RepID=UPI0007F3ED86|nr:hypothetical protein [Streptomyces sp. ERV7]OAR24659.1 hypothetical protein A8W25_20015 [Streptomyces sp. ERV7]